jgi:hypothetical protein
MNALADILNMICTEAFECGSIPQAPDQGEQSMLRYDLELVEQSDGRLEWLE